MSCRPLVHYEQVLKSLLSICVCASSSNTSKKAFAPPKHTHMAAASYSFCVETRHSQPDHYDVFFFPHEQLSCEFLFLHLLFTLL